jgi:hypothetical protein
LKRASPRLRHDSFAKKISRIRQKSTRESTW